jgi:DinB superfamily
MNLIELLNKTQNETLNYFNLPTADLAKAYAPDKWTVRQLLVHLADAESVLHERIKRIIAEPKKVIWAFDQDLWEKHLDYANFPLHISQSLYQANRQSVIYLASQFYETLGNREFVHSETGIRTLKDEFDKVAWHNQGHLQQIRTAINKL